MNAIILTIGESTINQIDSVAKHVSPQADVHNIYWWIGILVVAIVGIASFLLKHYFKGICLDGRPHPVIKIKGKKAKKLVLPKCNAIDQDKRLSRELQEKMTDLEKKYPAVGIDPYQDMNLIFASNFNSAKNYNNDVESYKEDMREYYSRTIKDRLMSESMREVKFVLYAKGKKACSNLNVELTIDGKDIHVYSADSRQVKIGKRDKEPDKNEDRSSELYGLFPSDQEEYEYAEWSLKEQSRTNHYICQSLVSGCPREDVVPSLFVDTRYVQEITINWKINGADIPESGEKGVLVIRVK